MPELPDLHVFAKNLRKHILSKPIQDVGLHNMLRINELEANVKQALIDSYIADIKRIGKELFFYLDSGYVFSVHLMLNGKFSIAHKEEIPKIKYKIMSLTFEDGSALTVSDYKGMCKITFRPQITNVPDAFSDGFTREYLLGVAGKNKRMNIKAFLINQKIIKGIGNAYADEILYHANLSPESITGKIPEERLIQLHGAVIRVLQEAIENIERISPDIINGEERSFLKVHNPKLNVTAGGEKIIVRTIASKITYYTRKQEVFL
jgi:formamidopyrimidine-DNA glycosylase